MQTSIYEYVMAKLDAREPPLREVASATEIPYSTLKRIANRGNTSWQRIERLFGFFQKQEARRRRKSA